MRLQVTALLFALALVWRDVGYAEPKVVESEAIVEDAEAWRTFGFRVQLRIGYEQLTSLEDQRQGNGYSLTVEPSVRLSESLSVGAGIRYSVPMGELEGLRWSMTADVGYHPWKGLLLGGGLGYSGMMAKSIDPAVFGDGLLSYCNGDGVVGLVRAGYLFVVGELFSTGPMLQGDLQLARCAAERVEMVTVADGDYSYDATKYRPYEVTRTFRALQLTWAFAWR